MREKDESRMNSRRLKFWARVTGRVELLSTKVGKVAATAGVVGKVSSIEMCKLECELE